jgi:hypothetical protein
MSVPAILQQVTCVPGIFDAQLTRHHRASSLAFCAGNLAIHELSLSALHPSRRDQTGDTGATDAGSMSHEKAVNSAFLM